MPEEKRDTPKDILQDFAHVRLKIYETYWSQYTAAPLAARLLTFEQPRRKAYLLARLTRECEAHLRSLATGNWQTASGWP